MDQTREGKGLHFAIGQKHFHVSYSEVFDVQTSCNSINPNWLSQTSDAGGVYPFKGVECGEGTAGINHTSAHVLNVSTKGSFSIGCHGVSGRLESELQLFQFQWWEPVGLQLALESSVLAEPLGEVFLGGQSERGNSTEIAEH